MVPTVRPLMIKGRNCRTLCPRVRGSPPIEVRVGRGPPSLATSIASCLLGGGVAGWGKGARELAALERVQPETIDLRRRLVGGERHRLGQQAVERLVLHLAVSVDHIRARRRGGQGCLG